MPRRPRRRLEEGGVEGVPPPCAEGPAGGSCAKLAPLCAEDPTGALGALTEMDRTERLRVLAGRTARFAVAYLRWLDTNAAGGLRYPRLRLLEILHRSGPAIMRDLAGQLGMTARNMTATVDALEDAGLVERRPHPADRRATLVHLTPAGADAAASAGSAGLDPVGAVFASLGDAEQQQFVELIGRLSVAMCADAPGRADPAPAP